ncbi:protein JASON-like isoform X2 [Coffea arabica]|uniref:Protein JASON-like isoform X2 n=1 Tax=Coffea arabica TaxID=13443 RepID=A0ABM4UH33_COFAR
MTFLTKTMQQGFSQVKMFFTKMIGVAVWCCSKFFLLGMLSRNWSSFSSLPLSGENEDARAKLIGDQDLGIPKPQRGFNLKELKDEACRTLRETPANFCQAPEKWNNLSAQKGGSENSRCRSWMTNTSVEERDLEVKFEQPLTPVKCCGRWVKVSGSLEHKSSRQTAGRVSTSSTEGKEIEDAGSVELIASSRNGLTGSLATPRDISPFIIDVGTGGTSAGQELKVEASWSSWSSWPRALFRDPDGDPEHNEFAAGENSHCRRIQVDRSILGMDASDWDKDESHVSPKWWNGNGVPNSTDKYKEIGAVTGNLSSVTSLQLSEDKENDGTPTKLKEDLHLGTPRPKRGSDLNELKDEVGAVTGNQTPLSSALLSEETDGTPTKLKEDQDLGTPKPELESNIKKLKDEVWAMCWIKFQGRIHKCKEVSPKWWDGNGIPNTTHKYREDRKVCWHETPFEERLEKALFEETFIRQRRQTSRAINFGSS